MAYIEVINGANVLQINDSFVNLSLAQSGAFSLGGVVNMGRYGNINYTSNGESQPMLAINSPHLHTVIAYSRNGNNHSWLVTSPASSGGAGGTYYIFDLPGNTLSGRGEFSCWDANGRVIFDSAGKYMRVATFQQNVITDPPGNQWFGSGGRTYAVVISGTAYVNDLRLLPSPPNPPNTSMPGNWRYARVAEHFGYAISGNQLSWSKFQYEGGEEVRGTAREGYSFTGRQAAAMVIDVTGY